MGSGLNTFIPPQAIPRLQNALESRASEKTRTFWNNYLKGNARFRGVPMAGVRTVVHEWWKKEGLHELSIAAQKEVALHLFEEEYSEDKLAGMLALSEILLPHLSKKDLPSFTRLFAQGHISDWNITDWFCLKVLGKMLEHADDPTELAHAISAWHLSKPLWQRRAACVAFVNHAKFGDEKIAGLPNMIMRSCEALVLDPERFAQTGVGWVLRELSLFDQARVISFAERHIKDLSREAIKSLAEKMPDGQKKRLLGMHKT